MDKMKLNIQMFSNPKLVIDTKLNTKNFENGLDRIKSASQKAGGTIKQIVASLGIAKAVSIAMSQIENSIDGAISRFDTLSNFPKVMSNLGIGAEEADKSIKKLSDKLSGLPTTLDEAALSVQRLTSKNGNISKSTDLFLALNNAILAGGASSEIQSSALEQLSQAYAKGKPDMMEWRTAMTAMPAQLKQVAKAMGYVDADALGEALREGTVSMDEFMDTIIELNKKGVDGFQSFEKQARNSTGGIQTSITVAKTQVVKGVTDILEALNKSFEKTKFGSLSNFISEVGKGAKVGLDEVAKVISGELSLYDFGKEITDIVIKMVTKFNEELPQMINVGISLILQLVNGISQGVPILIEKVLEIPFILINSIADNYDSILDAGLNLLIKIAEGIERGLPKVADGINKVVDRMLEEMNKPETRQKFVEVATQILISLVRGIIMAMPKVREAMIKIRNEILRSILNLPGRMVQVGIDIVKGIWRGIKQRAGQLKQDVANFAQGIVDTVTAKLKIKSPSRVFRDEVGKQIPAGIGVGFKEGIADVYKDMQHAIELEQAKLESSVQTGRIFNTIQNTTPVVMNINADVEMDSQKVGRLVTPTVTRTIKNGGGV